MAAAPLRARIESSLGERLSSTLLLRERAAPAMVSTGIAALDALTGGLPRGALSEITGAASSGRTGVMLAALAAATQRQEICALVDAGDSFDPASAAAAGVDLERLLWVRCKEADNNKGRQAAGDQNARVAFAGVRMGSPANAGFAFAGALEQVLKATDLLLHAGGFGMVALDLGDIPPESARRVPLTSWFRFRRAVEPTATVLLLLEQEPCAKTCASLVLRLEREAVCTREAASSAAEASAPLEWHIVGRGTAVPDNPVLSHARVPPSRPQLARGWESTSVISHAVLLHGMQVRAEVLRSWAQRKPAQSAAANFVLQAAFR